MEEKATLQCDSGRLELYHTLFTLVGSASAIVVTSNFIDICYTPEVANYIGASVASLGTVLSMVKVYTLERKMNRAK